MQKKTSFAIPRTSLQTQSRKITWELLGPKWQNRMVSRKPKRKRTAWAKRQRILPSLARRKDKKREERERERNGGRRSAKIR